MSNRILTVILLALTLTIVFALTTNIHPVRAYDTSDTIYIKEDGSIYPGDAPISRSGDLYTVSDNIASSNQSGALKIERNNTILDGAGYTLAHAGIEDVQYGIFLEGRSNVTIKNLNITGFVSGILLENSDNNTIRGNNITANIASEGGDGIDLYWSSFNYVSENNITDNSNEGMFLLDSSDNNTIIGNTIANNDIGIYIGSSNNRVYHNNFLDNTVQASFYESTNFWDNGYPSGGNYWSDNNGTDLYRGPYQNETGSDGIADYPYYLDETSQKDSYPLMGPFGGVTNTGMNVTVFPTPNICFIFEQVTKAGSTTAIPSTPPTPPPGFKLIGSYYEIGITAEYSGKITIRMTYDATGMTPDQESRLVLLRYDALATDVNKDSKVDWKDVCKVLMALGSRPGTRRWDPACDINHDGIINCKDLAAVLKNLGKSAWTNITTFVDKENHLIFAETSHFSGIGIHQR
jgi:parallel beta-helix repeat protein